MRQIRSIQTVLFLILLSFSLTVQPQRAQAQLQPRMTIDDFSASFEGFCLNVNIEGLQAAIAALDALKNLKVDLQALLNISIGTTTPTDCLADIGFDMGFDFDFDLPQINGCFASFQGGFQMPDFNMDGLMGCLNGAFGNLNLGGMFDFDFNLPDFEQCLSNPFSIDLSGIVDILGNISGTIQAVIDAISSINLAINVNFLGSLQGLASFCDIFPTMIADGSLDSSGQIQELQNTIQRQQKRIKRQRAQIRRLKGK